MKCNRTKRRLGENQFVWKEFICIKRLELLRRLKPVVILSYNTCIISVRRHAVVILDQRKKRWSLEFLVLINVQNISRRGRDKR